MTRQPIDRHEIGIWLTAFVGALGIAAFTGAFIGLVVKVAMWVYHF